MPLQNELPRQKCQTVLKKVAPEMEFVEHIYSDKVKIVLKGPDYREFIWINPGQTSRVEAYEQLATEFLNFIGVY